MQVGQIFIIISLYLFVRKINQTVVHYFVTEVLALSFTNQMEKFKVDKYHLIIFLIIVGYSSFILIVSEPYLVMVHSLSFDCLEEIKMVGASNSFTLFVESNWEEIMDSFTLLVVPSLGIHTCFDMDLLALN